MLDNMLAYKFIIDQQAEQRILTLANAVKQKKELQLQKKKQQPSSGNRFNNIPQGCLSVSNI
eukprot:scaffold2845_cov50-Cylindrotheca_fusiformis.AAC.3